MEAQLSPAPLRLRLVFLLLCFFPALLRFVSTEAEATAPTLVTALPGFDGALPFRLETGYVTVDEENGAELFYYFIQSERDPRRDPVVLWLTGGDRCTVLSALFFEIGPLKFIAEPYHNNGTAPRLRYHPYSWTKVASVLFVDSPVGAGFSFSRNPQGYQVGDVSSSLHLKTFLTKWFTEHPDYLANPFYVGGDSYGGKLVPFLAHKISEDIEAGLSPLINLKGYLVGNPGTGEAIDHESRVPFLHGVGVISDQLYEAIKEHCPTGDYFNPKNMLCAQAMDKFNRLYDEISNPHILYKKCAYVSPRPNDQTSERKMLKEETGALKRPPLVLQWIAMQSSHDSSDGAREMMGESNIASPPPQRVATSGGAAPDPPAREVLVVAPQNFAGGASGSPSEHPFVQEAKRLVGERLALEAKLWQLQEEHNDSLREVDALKKSLGQSEQKAEAAVGAKERLELELSKAAEAKERLQQEAADREEQLATVAAARERGVAAKLMAAAKAISENFGNYLSYFWANNNVTRETLGIKKGSKDEWVRCHDGDLPYSRDIKSSIIYHHNMTTKGYRALVYSGDHDAVIPFRGTQSWVRSLSFTVINQWRAWHLDGQSAGFTITYTNNLTFTTIKGGGHTAPEYQPERCLAMFSSWVSGEPL